MIVVPDESQLVLLAHALLNFAQGIARAVNLVEDFEGVHRGRFLPHRALSWQTSDDRSGKKEKARLQNGPLGWWARTDLNR